MKKILLFVLALFIYSQIDAQDSTNWGMPYNSVKKIFIYEEVVAVSGISKDELYKRAESWIATYYTSGLKKIYEKSQTDGYIRLNHRFPVMKTVKGQIINDVIINYKMELSFKDGKYRFQIFKFYCGVDANSQPIEKWMLSTYSDPEVAKERYKKIDLEVQKAITSLKAAMLKPVPVKTDNW